MKKLITVILFIFGVVLGSAGTHAYQYMAKQVAHHNMLVELNCEGDEICIINNSW